MVVIREFYPCQLDIVSKYAEQKRIEKEIESKLSQFKEILQPETPTTDISNPKIIRSLISPTMDFELFLKETERHLIEAKQFGHQITSIHNAVQALNNLKSSDLLLRLRAGNDVAEEANSVSSSEKAVTFQNEVERYANGTIVQDNTNQQSKRRLTSPVSIASLEEYKLHGRLCTPEYQSYHLLNRDKTLNIKTRECSSQESNSWVSMKNSSSFKLQKKGVIKKEHEIKRRPETITERKPVRQLSPRVPVCPPKVKEMLEQVKQRKCTNNRVALPISVLNLKLF